MHLQSKIAYFGRNRVHKHVHTAPAVRIDEKIDGSQITFGVFDGKLRIRSRSRDLDLDQPDGMFRAAVEAIGKRVGKLWLGYTYWGEYLQKERHNVLTYERVPAGHVVLFDVVQPDGTFLSLEDLRACAAHAGFDVVPSTEYVGHEAVNRARSQAIPAESLLGGPAEGIVLKAGSHVDDRITAKVVAPAFKEVKKDCTQRSRINPDADLAVTVANKFCPPERFRKAVQRLRDAGELVGSMRDMPKIIDEVRRDLEDECTAEMQAYLYEHYRKRILGTAVHTVADWYEQYLTNDNAFWTEVRQREDDVRPGEGK